MGAASQHLTANRLEQRGFQGLPRWRSLLGHTTQPSSLPSPFPAPPLCFLTARPPSSLPQILLFRVGRFCLHSNSSQTLKTLCRTKGRQRAITFLPHACVHRFVLPLHVHSIRVHVHACTLTRKQPTEVLTLRAGRLRPGFLPPPRVPTPTPPQRPSFPGCPRSRGYPRSFCLSPSLSEVSFLPVLNCCSVSPLSPPGAALPE